MLGEQQAESHQRIYISIIGANFGFLDYCAGYTAIWPLAIDLSSNSKNTVGAFSRNLKC